MESNEIYWDLSRDDAKWYGMYVFVKSEDEIMQARELLQQQMLEIAKRGMITIIRTHPDGRLSVGIKMKIYLEEEQKEGERHGTGNGDL